MTTLRGRTRNTKVINAPRERVYQAFIDRNDLLAWLPPGEMSGTFHRFAACVGGGYRISLVYPPTEGTYRGKTSDLEDVVDVRFMALEPPHRIVEAVDFVSDDPDFTGEVTLTVTLVDVPDGTEVTMTFENLPPGIRPEDNEVGADMSLNQLAAYLTAPSAP